MLLPEFMGFSVRMPVPLEFGTELLVRKVIYEMETLIRHSGLKIENMKLEKT